MSLGACSVLGLLNYWNTVYNGKAVMYTDTASLCQLDHVAVRPQSGASLRALTEGLSRCASAPAEDVMLMLQIPRHPFLWAESLPTISLRCVNSKFRHLISLRFTRTCTAPLRWETRRHRYKWSNGSFNVCIPSSVTYGTFFRRFQGYALDVA